MSPDRFNVSQSSEPCSGAAAGITLYSSVGGAPMRQLVFWVLAVAVSLGGIVGSTAQTSTPSMWITITAGAAGYATVAVARSEMYIDGGPVAGIGPRGAGTSSPPLKFNIRAWNEGQKARVVVYAR